MLKVIYETDRCPVCKGDDLEYSEMRIEREQLVYPFICPHCGAKGVERYDIMFDRSEAEEA